MEELILEEGSFPSIDEYARLVDSFIIEKFEIERKNLPERKYQLDNNIPHAVTNFNITIDVNDLEFYAACVGAILMPDPSIPVNETEEECELDNGIIKAHVLIISSKANTVRFLETNGATIADNGRELYVGDDAGYFMFDTIKTSIIFFIPATGKKVSDIMLGIGQNPKQDDTQKTVEEYLVVAYSYGGVVHPQKIIAN